MLMLLLLLLLLLLLQLLLLLLLLLSCYHYPQCCWHLILDHTSDLLSPELQKLANTLFDLRKCDNPSPLGSTTLIMPTTAILCSNLPLQNPLKLLSIGASTVEPSRQRADRLLSLQKINKLCSRFTSTVYNSILLSSTFSVLSLV